MHGRQQPSAFLPYSILAPEVPVPATPKSNGTHLSWEGYANGQQSDLELLKLYIASPAWHFPMRVGCGAVQPMQCDIPACF